MCWFNLEYFCCAKFCHSKFRLFNFAIPNFAYSEPPPLLYGETSSLGHDKGVPKYHRNNMARHLYAEKLWNAKPVCVCVCVCVVWQDY